MGSAEEKSQSAKYIKPKVRKAIKEMAYISQIANCVSLLPTPEDFASQVVGEVVILAGKVKSLSERISMILEAYSNFPTDFITDATNQMLNSINRISNIGSQATQNMVDTLHQATDDIDYLTTGTVGILTDLITEENMATRYLGDTVDNIHEGLDKVSDKIDDFNDKVDSINEKVQNKLQKVVNYITEKMQKINDDLNDTFGEFMIIDLPEPNEYIFENSPMVGDIVSANNEMIKSISENFNIGKVTKGLIGFATNLGLVYNGLDQLPQLNMENVLAFGRAKLDEFDEKQYWKVKEFKESDEYKRMVEEAEGDKKKLREKLRNKRRSSASEVRKSMKNLTKEEREQRRSVAKDIRKKKLQAKNAKTAQKIKETIKFEIQQFKNDITTFSNNIQYDWFTMQDIYTNAVKEIKEYFTGDDKNNYGSKYIDDCCDAIEMDCDSIKETAQNLVTIITVDVSQIPAPTSIGSCFDNPLYKVLRWFECMKSIFNEIRKIINFGIDIIRQINNIVKIILNGINSLKEIKEKIIELLDIKWLLDFIDSIIELFTGKCLEGKELLENSLSPVFWNETDEYEQEIESIESRIGLPDLSEATKNTLIKNLEDIEKEGEEVIVAYKSPLLNDDGTDFKGWVFFHSNIDNMYTGNRLKQKFSRSIIKRAAKTGHRKKGGVNKLKSKKVYKLKTPMTIKGKKEYKPYAYDAFYWYTNWTNDPNDDTVETNNTGRDVIRTVMTTENGTLVELEDGRRVFVNDYGVKSGDYVIVEGKRYMIK